MVASKWYYKDYMVQALGGCHSACNVSGSSQSIRNLLSTYIPVIYEPPGIWCPKPKAFASLCILTVTHCQRKIYFSGFHSLFNIRKKGRSKRKNCTKPLSSIYLGTIHLTTPKPSSSSEQTSRERPPHPMPAPVSHRVPYSAMPLSSLWGA